jgi:hypothetical protein
MGDVGPDGRFVRVVRARSSSAAALRARPATTIGRPPCAITFVRWQPARKMQLPPVYDCRGPKLLIFFRWVLGGSVQPYPGPRAQGAADVHRHRHRFPRPCMNVLPPFRNIRYFSFVK